MNKLIIVEDMGETGVAVYLPSTSGYHPNPVEVARIHGENIQRVICALEDVEPRKNSIHNTLDDMYERFSCRIWQARRAV